MDTSISSAQLINDFIKKNPEKIERVNNAIMESKFHPIRAIYFDINTLKDTRLGLLLNICTEEEQNYICSRMKEYNYRPNRSFLYAFPELPYTEKQLREMYADPARSEDIFNKSPDTVVSLDLLDVMVNVMDNNAKVEYRDKVRIDINMFPLKITPLMEMYRTILEYTLGDKAVSVRLLSTDPAKISANQWQGYQIWFIDDLEHLVNEKSYIYEPLLKHRRYMNTYVYASPTCSDDVLHQWEDEGTDFSNIDQVNLRFELTSLYFSICCQFQFVRFEVPYEGDS